MKRILVLAVCGSQAQEQGGVAEAPQQIDDGWTVAAPSAVGADAALLDTMLARIQSGDYTGIHAVLVAKDGSLVVEQYFDGHDRNTLHEIRSATKVFGSILTGMAIDQGYIKSEKEPIYTYFEDDYTPAGGWSERSRREEIRHFLSMMSGYECDDLATSFACEDGMHASGDWVQSALDLPLAYEAGEHWAYNSASLILVGEAVARAAGTTLAEFAQRNLFEPLGIERFQWMTSPKGRAWIGGGAEMIPREMAKIGQLMLERGVWNGRRLLSEDWIDKSTRKQGEWVGAGVDYCYLWQKGRTYSGQERVTAYWASGNGGQHIIVLPDHGIVVVFTAGNYNSPLANQPFEILVRYVVPAFLRPAALEPVTLSVGEIERLVGEYHLDFEPNALSVIEADGSGIRLLSPDNEWIPLTAHSPSFFTGDSRYGFLTVIFDEDETGGVDRHTVYGSFQRFVFER
jgi:CubicO group peptidase (beta-lactamase class C family)